MTPRIAFSWSGLPQYAARLLKAAIDELGEPCVVIGSKPRVPVKGMEQVLGQAVTWVDGTLPTSWQKLGLDIPKIFFQSGWGHAAFMALGREVKINGGRVIGFSDANWRGDFRQRVLGKLAFQVKLARHFDAMLVPGQQGKRLMQHYGMAAEKIHTGLYGADPALFNGGPPLGARPKEFLFVGQFIARKDVLGLVRAFQIFNATRSDWHLRLIGSGVQRPLIAVADHIIVQDFVQPEALAAYYRRARFFILPSLVEAWGLVVHEAASCGCGLILSDAVGSSDDLAGPDNALSFKAGDAGALAKALLQAADFDDSRLQLVETASRRLAAQFGPQRFAKEIRRLV